MADVPPLRGEDVLAQHGDAVTTPKFYLSLILFWDEILGLVDLYPGSGPSCGVFLFDSLANYSFVCYSFLSFPLSGCVLS